MPRLVNPMILNCSCGQSLLLYDEGHQFRFQHGDNPEHSYTGPKLHDELLPAWRRGPDISIEVLAEQQIVIRGDWIDSVHARLSDPPLA